MSGPRDGRIVSDRLAAVLADMAEGVEPRPMLTVTCSDHGKAVGKVLHSKHGVVLETEYPTPGRVVEVDHAMLEDGDFEWRCPRGGAIPAEASVVSDAVKTGARTLVVGHPR